MSSTAEFDDAYAESRGRLLLQLYAYCGDADAADDALNEAYITASRHWHRIRFLTTLDAWLRTRAIKRLDGRPRSLPVQRGTSPVQRGPSQRGPVQRGPSQPGPANPQPEPNVAQPEPAGSREPSVAQPEAAGSREPSAQSARLLAALAALDPTSRRLLIVRRLGQGDLPAAAREVGLTDGAAEQALARASSTLHGNGVDTTPAGLAAGLARLGDALERLDIPTARTLRRAGARRRYAAGTVLAVTVVAAAVGAGLVTAAGPSSSPPVRHPPTTQPTTTPPPVRLPVLGAEYLVTNAQVSRAGNAGWRTLPAADRPTSTSIYGDCTEAADNPPPNTSWIRDFASGTGAARATLRQVLQLAPSTAESLRSFRQILTGFALCRHHQLVDYSRVTGLGERAQVVRLRTPTATGPVLETLAAVKSGVALTVLTSSSAPGRGAALSPRRLVRLAGVAVDQVCKQTSSRCARSPYDLIGQHPPRDPTGPGFLSVVDLPLVPHVAPAWVATDPQLVDTNPSATPCDQTDFVGGGASSITSRSYVVPQATALPTLFGLTETRATFETRVGARAFVDGVAMRVARCHRRQVTLAVLASAAFADHRMSGRVWQVRQQVSKRRVVTFRIALVRLGASVGQVTFTPVGGYDVSRLEFVTLAKRAAVRLGE